MSESNPVEKQRREEDRSALGLLLLGVALLFVVFFVYNALVFEGTVRTVALVHDAILIVTVFGAALLVRGNKVAPACIEPLRFVMMIGVLSNISVVSFMRQELMHTPDFALLLVGLGAFMQRPFWAGIGALLTLTAWYVILGPLAEGYQWNLLLVSGTMVGGILFVTRYQTTSTIDQLRRTEWQQRLGLEGALREANILRKELDARVASRTEELTHAMESLRQEYNAREALAEQLRHIQRVELVGSLAGSVAHDFNNQLTVIRAGTEVAASLIEDEEIREHLEDVNFAADRAAAITRQLLVFSRKQVEEPRIVDLSAAVADLRRTLIRLIHKEVELDFDLPKHKIPVHMDPVQLEQIIVNLVVNARDAAPKGRVSISVSDRKDETGEWAVFEVSDNGSGMDEATRYRIFEPFFTTKPAGKGTGLGLATVKRIVNQHGGEISVASEVNNGTTVTIALPVTREEEEDHLAEGPIVPGQGTILAVDDQPQVLKMAVALFKNLGYDVIAANSGAEALKLVRKHPGSIDILWTDVLMPTMNGRELAERIRKRYPHASVVFASGYTADVLGDGTLPEHAYFVSKPYSLRTVSQAIARINARTPPRETERVSHLRSNAPRPQEASRSTATETLPASAEYTQPYTGDGGPDRTATDHHDQDEPNA